MILLAEHDEPILAAKKKRQPGASSWPTSTPKNRVWDFENSPSGRPVVELQLSWETATGSVQYTYQIASGRAEWLSRDPLKSAEVLQGPNLYGYVLNDPIDLIDPMGLRTWSEYWDSWEEFFGFTAEHVVPGGEFVGGAKASPYLAALAIEQNAETALNNCLINTPECGCEKEFEAVEQAKKTLREISGS